MNIPLIYYDCAGSYMLYFVTESSSHARVVESTSGKYDIGRWYGGSDNSDRWTEKDPDG